LTFSACSFAFAAWWLSSGRSAASDSGNTQPDPKPASLKRSRAMIRHRHQLVPASDLVGFDTFDKSAGWC
jgi:hypothetical protein